MTQAPIPQQPVIEVNDLVTHYGERRILKGVSLTIQQGEIMVIMGGSGSGKSTLLRHMMALEKATSGSIKLFGNELSELSQMDLYKLCRKIGVSFQGGALFDSMTVGENIGYTLLEHTDQSLDEIEQTVRKTLRFLNLSEDLIDQLPDELSGGMQRRVAIGRALAAIDPEIMLYDEPTTGLDPISTKSIVDMIIKLRDIRRVSSIIVTHQIADAFRMTEHFIMIEDGRIVFDGTGPELLCSEHPRVKAFLGPFLRSVAALPHCDERDGVFGA